MGVRFVQGHVIEKVETVDNPILFAFKLGCVSIGSGLGDIVKEIISRPQQMLLTGP